MFTFAFYNFPELTVWTAVLNVCLSIITGTVQRYDDTNCNLTEPRTNPGQTSIYTYLSRHTCTVRDVVKYRNL